MVLHKIVWPSAHTLPGGSQLEPILFFEFWKNQIWDKKGKPNLRITILLRSCKTCRCIHSSSRKSRTSTSSKSWGSSSRNNLRHWSFTLNVSPSSHWRVTTAWLAVCSTRYCQSSFMTLPLILLQEPPTMVHCWRD
jgi:hypothetical protein